MNKYGFTIKTNMDKEMELMARRIAFLGFYAVLTDNYDGTMARFIKLNMIRQFGPGWEVAVVKDKAVVPDDHKEYLIAKVYDNVYAVIVRL